MANYAKEIIIPKESGIFRTVFLYVGQGDSTLLIVPNGEHYKFVLIDTNNDKKNCGIDNIALLKDLLDESLDVFINTHPHKDHLTGIKEIYKAIGIKEIWHSGHKPGRDYDEAYQEMKEVLKSMCNENEFILFGTNDLNKIRKADKETEIIKKIGEVDFIILAPAEFVSEDIDNETPKDRNKRIHEQCSVIKFSYGREEKKLLITGDSDKKAWKDYISYHNDKLPSQILKASHHGSRTFFKDNEEDNDPFEKHIEKINPSYVIISAPKQSESSHGHPHDDSLKLYQKHIDETNILHLGKNRECVIVDIDKDGKIEIKIKNNKDLVEHYGFSQDKNGSNLKNTLKTERIGLITPKIDRKPMG
ncbi:MAG: competence protein ComEC [Desulfobacterales bacterium]|nr:competence protein ComEC [Desulfobacterales bacterium]